MYDFVIKVITLKLEANGKLKIKNSEQHDSIHFIVSLRSAKKLCPML